MMEKLIKVLNKMNPDHLNGAIILHMDKQTKRLKSISPMLPAESMDELLLQLSEAYDAIKTLRDDLIDKNMKHNNRLS